MSAASSGQIIRTSRELYKYLFRVCEKLPKEAQNHYKHHVRQSFNSHADEIDPQRVTEIISRAVQDADWILKKYTAEK
ncbi:LYR motif-containing protein 9-like [Amphiura filiformis]|uniref:LYR motif-containing protein 9-like n=1 Tax=Amphiura filiformis TaxID=82378 RepID=UPI003B224477